jgi:hypothetical protein
LDELEENNERAMRKGKQQNLPALNLPQVNIYPQQQKSKSKYSRTS